MKLFATNSIKTVKYCQEYFVFFSLCPAHCGPNT